LGFVVCSTVYAKQPESSVRPGVNDGYLAADMQVDRWVQRLEVESREVVALRRQLLAEVGVETGMSIADVGAGTGLFVPLFAEAVGSEGRVYAVDIVPKFAAHIRDRASEDGLEQVTVVLNHDRSISLAPNSADIVFICDVYHHFEFPRSMLASIHRALRADGVLIVIDFEKIPGKTPQRLMDHVRAGKETVMDEIRAEGFHLQREVKVDGLEENYFLRFSKK